MKIRYLRQDDLCSVVALVERIKIIDLSKKEIYQTLKSDFEWISKTFSLALVAEEKEKIVGLITLEEYERTRQGVIAELGYIAVDKDYQQKSVATKLYEEAVRRLKKNILKNNFFLRLIKAEVDSLDNTAQSFYTNLGMEKAVEIPNYWSQENGLVIFVKRFN